MRYLTLFFVLLAVNAGIGQPPVPSPEAELRTALLAAKDNAELLALIEASPQLFSWAFIQSLKNQSPRDPYVMAQMLSAALVIAKGSNDQTALRSILPNLGNASGAYGNYEASVAYFEEAVEFGKQVGDKDYLRRILFNLGNAYDSLGHLDKAIAASSQSIALAQELGKTADSLGAFVNLSNHYRRKGDQFRSVDSLLKARDLLEELAKTSADLMKTSPASAVYSSLATALKQMGHNDLALEAYNRALKINQELGRPVAPIYINMGNAFSNMGEKRRAIELYDAAAQEETTQKSTIATALGNKAAICLELADYPCAYENYKKAGEIRSELGRLTDADRLELAISQFRLGQLDAALPVAESIAGKGKRTEFETEAFYSNAVSAKVLAARIYGAKGNQKLQQEFLNSAIEVASELYEVHSGYQAGLSFLKPLYTAAHHDAIDLLITQNNLSNALFVSEQLRARSIVEIFGNRERGKAAPGITAEMRTLEEALSGRLISLNRQISVEVSKPTPDKKWLGRLESDVREAQTRRDAFQLSLYRSQPAVAMARGRVPSFSLNDASEFFASGDQAIIEFVVSKEATYVFALTADAAGAPSIAAKKVVLGQDILAEKVRNYTTDLEQGGQGFAPVARELYERLLKPVEGVLAGKTEIIIIPDGSLWELPFQALRDDKGKYLIEKTAVSYAPSLTALREMRKSARVRGRKRDVQHELLVFGNPIVAGETKERVRRVFMNEKLEPIPEAERLANELGRIYGSRASKLYTGEGAREEVAKAESPKYRIIQFATHGMLNNVSPMYSHLVFAKDPKNPDEDGLLEAWELKEMDLNADLVIFSACDTARGKISGGEGVIGITWAAFIAGAPTTIASQWKVESSSTTEFMLEFHRQMLGNKKISKAEALRRASLKLMKSAKYRHPSYWAPWVLVGDGS